MPSEPLSSFVAFGLQVFRADSNAVHVALCAAFIVLRADFAEVLYVSHAVRVAPFRVFWSVCAHAALSVAWRVWSAVFIAGYCMSHAAIIALSRVSTAVCMHESAAASSAPPLDPRSSANAMPAPASTITIETPIPILLNVFMYKKYAICH